MLRSMFAGITGMRSHQTMMDVVGNNIANVNSAGFKSSSVVFEDTLSQLVKPASTPQGTSGGTNPSQVGLGVKLAGISTNFSQGSAQVTGRSTDLMIQGDGFFMIKDGPQNLYTRNGSFSLDANGQLVTQDGAVVQGFNADATGALQTTMGALRLQVGAPQPPRATDSAEVSGNVPSDLALATPISSSIKVYDGQGNEHALGTTWTRTDVNTWDMQMFQDGTALGTPQTITFGTDGKVSDPASGEVTFTPDQTFTPTWSGTGAITVDLGTVTQYGGQNSLASTQQNGAAQGALQSFSINQKGEIIGVYSNGQKQTMGQLLIASFSNPPGLEKVGNGSYRETVNSGQPVTGSAGDAGRGLLAGGMLEMSNVDLAAEFTNMIIAQRGFQANSRVISTSDDILQELVNLKR